MCKLKVGDGFNVTPSSAVQFCEGCVFGKNRRLPYPTSRRDQKKKKGDLVQTDVCCPMRTQKAPFRLLAVFISGIGTTHIVLKTAVYSLKTCPN